MKLKDELERSKKAVKDKVYIERDSRDKDGKIKDLEESNLAIERQLEELKFSNDILKVLFLCVQMFTDIYSYLIRRYVYDSGRTKKTY